LVSFSPLDYFLSYVVLRKSVYGFDFSPLIPLTYAQVISKPKVCDIKEEQVLAEPHSFLEIDIYTIKMEELREMKKEISWTIEKTGIVQAICVWFDVEFEDRKGNNQVILSTAPSSPSTHWKQTVFFLPNGTSVSEKQNIRARVAFKSDEENFRQYNVTIEVGQANEEEESPKMALLKALGLSPDSMPSLFTPENEK